MVLVYLCKQQIEERPMVSAQISASDILDCSGSKRQLYTWGSGVRTRQKDEPHPGSRPDDSWVDAASLVLLAVA